MLWEGFFGLFTLRCKLSDIAVLDDAAVEVKSHTELKHIMELLEKSYFLRRILVH